MTKFKLLEKRLLVHHLVGSQIGSFVDKLDLLRTVFFIPARPLK